MAIKKEEDDKKEEDGKVKGGNGEKNSKERATIKKTNDRKNTWIITRNLGGERRIVELSKLSQPFSVGDLEWRVGSVNADRTNGLALPYVTNRAIQERLDQVAGPLNWKNEYERWDNKGVKCGISLRTEDEWVTKYDGADETNIEPTKGGFSDAMKRAAVQWGIGRYLYDMPAVWVPLEHGRIGKETLENLQRRYVEYIRKKHKSNKSKIKD